MAFWIAQISDTHLSLEKPFFVENFRRIRDALASSRPDLAIASPPILITRVSTPARPDAGSRYQRLNGSATSGHCRVSALA
jgi:hypothetical protein